MKNYLTILIPIILVLACDKNSDPELIDQFPQMTFADSITGIWFVDHVMAEGEDRDEWPDFELEILATTDTAGTFIAKNVPEGAELLWPHISSWRRVETTQLDRSDSVLVYIEHFDSLLTIG